MTGKCRVRVSLGDYCRLTGHLFPGDDDEHGAALLAGVAESGGQLILHVREVHLASEDSDYVGGQFGYRALAPAFIHRAITRARDQMLAYLAVHNHHTDLRVGFSRIDLESHERGYPALLQISRGMPVGALVLGKRSMEADVWLRDGTRLGLDRAIVVGDTVRQLTASPEGSAGGALPAYDRQVRMFGRAGQKTLRDCRVAVIGLGGVGSLVAEYLARLGVGHFCLVDGDVIEESNLSRVVGATRSDVEEQMTKVGIAQRMILGINESAEVCSIADDVAKESVAKTLINCDYLFLAADSMRARLVFNALVHQYLIPGVQLGAKVVPGPDGELLDVISVNRPVRPGRGCLWCNQLIDPYGLALETKSDDERKAQAYGVEEPNPSVITLNAVSAAHAVNDFLLCCLGLGKDSDSLYYEHFHFLRSPQRTKELVKPRADPECPECSRGAGRFARADSVALPCVEG